jgi:pimeloyl-ACP methyl ester carboxylesterase
MPAKTIAALRVSKAWPSLRVMAKSWIRELIEMDAHSPDVEQYRSLSCPSLLLAGSVSPEHPMLDAARALAGVLPGVRFEWLPGQGHGGTRGAPELVARLMRSFLAG